MDPLNAMPPGELLWQEDGDAVTPTPDGWLGWTNPSREVIYARRMREMLEMVAELRGPAVMAR